MVLDICTVVMYKLQSDYVAGRFSVTGTGL